MKYEIPFLLHTSYFILGMDKPRFLIIGKILKPFSYRGELKVEILTDYPERFASLRTVYIGDDAKSFSVESTHTHGKYILLKLHGIDSDQQAGALRDQFLYVSIEDAVELPKDQIFLYQLVGLRAVTTDGQLLGTVTDVLDTNANDVYVVNDGAREILIPAIPDIVREINLERGEMIIRLIDGLV
jgi:16S rRNA processing protein RimM